MMHRPLSKQRPAVSQAFTGSDSGSNQALTMCAAVPQRTSTHSSIVCACGARYLSSNATTANSHTHIAPEQILPSNPQAIRHGQMSRSYLPPGRFSEEKHANSHPLIALEHILSGSSQAVRRERTSWTYLPPWSPWERRTVAKPQTPPTAILPIVADSWQWM